MTRLDLKTRPGPNLMEILMKDLNNLLNSFQPGTILTVDKLNQECKKLKGQYRNNCDDITNLFKITNKASLICIPPINTAEQIINWYSGNKEQISIDEAKDIIFRCCTDEVKADPRIQAFIKFDDFNPRPGPVDPAPLEDKVDFITYVRQNIEKCSFSAEHFQDCKKAWCASSLDKCAGVEMNFEDFNFD